MQTESSHISYRLQKSAPVFGKEVSELRSCVKVEVAVLDSPPPLP